MSNRLKFKHRFFNLTYKQLKELPPWDAAKLWGERSIYNEELKIHFDNKDIFADFKKRQAIIKEVMGKIKMPFGKHKGTEISKLDHRYIYGLCESNFLKDGPLKTVLYEYRKIYVPIYRSRYESCCEDEEQAFLDAYW